MVARIIAQEKATGGYERGYRDVGRGEIDIQTQKPEDVTVVRMGEASPQRAAGILGLEPSIHHRIDKE
jgi:hypothetical protein